MENVRYMGLSLAKLYSSEENPDGNSKIKVFYDGSEYSLDTFLDLPCETPLSLVYLKGTRPRIMLNYDSDDTIAFSLRSNILHFILIKGTENKGKRTSTNYPWIPTIDGIRVSRITEDEYKDAKLYNLMEFRD